MKFLQDLKSFAIAVDIDVDEVKAAHSLPVASCPPTSYGRSLLEDARDRVSAISEQTQFLALSSSSQASLVALCSAANALLNAHAKKMDELEDCLVPMGYVKFTEMTVPDASSCLEQDDDDEEQEEAPATPPVNKQRASHSGLTPRMFTSYNDDPKTPDLEDFEISSSTMDALRVQDKENIKTSSISLNSRFAAVSVPTKEVAKPVQQSALSSYSSSSIARSAIPSSSSSSYSSSVPTTIVAPASPKRRVSFVEEKAAAAAVDDLDDLDPPVEDFVPTSLLSFTPAAQVTTTPAPVTAAPVVATTTTTSFSATSSVARKSIEPVGDVPEIRQISEVEYNGLQSYMRSIPFASLCDTVNKLNDLLAANRFQKDANGFTYLKDGDLDVLGLGTKTKSFTLILIETKRVKTRKLEGIVVNYINCADLK